MFTLEAFWAAVGVTVILKLSLGAVIEGEIDDRNQVDLGKEVAAMLQSSGRECCILGPRRGRQDEKKRRGGGDCASCLRGSIHRLRHARIAADLGES